MRRLAVLTLVTTISLTLVLYRHKAVAQEGSGSSRAAPQRVIRPPTPEEFYQTFWAFVTKPESSYKKWGALPTKQDLHEAPEPHGEFVRIFANKTAVEKPDSVPLGSILIMESYGKDKKKLKEVTVMYRSKGVDAQHNDWYWLKYMPDGSIARTSDKDGKKPMAGKVAACIECHAKAGGKDYVYSNDPVEKPEEKPEDQPAEKSTEKPEDK